MPHALSKSGNGLLSFKQKEFAHANPPGLKEVGGGQSIYQTNYVLLQIKDDLKLIGRSIIAMIYLKHLSYPPSTV